MTYCITTHFISTEVALRKPLAEMRQVVEAELQKHGDPLRWAITDIKVMEQIAIVEAIVTRKDEG
jgi:hypothetical protein